jgi:hypothetical protein
MPVKEKEKYEITVQDRCDRCSAQAYVLARSEKGDLFFCGHHYKKHEEAVKSWAEEVIDEREKLEENKLIGSQN